MNQEILMDQLKKNVGHKMLFESARHKGHTKMRDHYTVDKLLGTGAYGEVRRCVYRKDVHDKTCTTK